MLGMTSIYNNPSTYGEDASVIDIGESRYLVQNIDVFTPIVDDPETQGRIAACNITNDLFACGVLNVTTMLSFLATPVDVPKWALAGILNGMQAFANDLGTTITKGQTIQNPWILVGGAASGFVEKENLITHAGVKPGDSIILTKPLGIQAIMALSRLIKNPEVADSLLEALSSDEFEPTIQRAIDLMTTSSKPVVEVIRSLAAKEPGEFKVHSMTDVTGFGLAGHAENLAAASGVDIVITLLPALNHAFKLSELFGYPLDEGRAHETAGGMLVAIAKEDEQRFVKAMDDAGITGHVVGRAVKGTGTAFLSDHVEYVET